MAASADGTPSRTSNVATAGAQPALKRALGRWDLTAIGINQVIGGGIFFMPATIAATIGGAAIGMFVIVGAASVIIALSFMALGRRYETTGGPYLYARDAFGDFAGFEIGWMLWFTRITSHAAVVNGVAVALGYFVPELGTGLWRAAVISTITIAFVALNVRGVDYGAFAINVFTAGKLIPLVIFIVIGFWFVDWNLFELPPLTIQKAASGALLLVFVFGGFEVVTLPGGEAARPRQHIPFALIATMVIVTAIFTLAQIVAVGTLPNLAASERPLADAASRFLGGPGGLLLTVGAIVSGVGNIGGQVFSSSRVLFAIAQDRSMRGPLAHVHPRYRTPWGSILFSGTVALALSLAGGFATMAAASASARLLTYIGTCGAAWRLTDIRRLWPALGIAISLLALAGITQMQFRAGIIALAAGAIVYVVFRPTSRLGQETITER